MSNRSRRMLPLVTALVAFAALLVPAGSASAVTTGTVSGTLTGPSGPLSSSTVEAFKVSAPDAYPAMTQADSQSSYSITLPAGQYYLRFSGSTDAATMAPEWWNDSSTRQGSTPVTVTAGGTVTANVVLAPGGSIAGYVATDYKQVGFHDTTVDAYQQDSSYAAGWVRLYSAEVSGEASDGKYLLRNLPSGNYRLHFYSQLTHREGWWPNATTLATATTVAVAAPAADTDINPDLPAAPSISGKVTVASTGSPVNQVYVTLFWNNHGTWQFTQYASTTHPDGTYKFYAPAGTYRVQFLPDITTKLRTEYWNNHSTVSVANDVNLAVATDTTGISAKLEKNVFKLTSAAAITGTYKVGYTLKAVPPKSTPTSTTTTYQWLRDGKPIIGSAAKRSYWKLVTADRHHKIGVKITLNRLGYVSLYRIVTKSTNLP